MTVNGVVAVTLRYFIEFGKPEFQLLTTCSRIELIDQKSASITRRNGAWSTEVSVRLCVTIHAFAGGHKATCISLHVTVTYLLTPLER